MIANWNDVERVRRDYGHLRGEWQDLGRAAGTVTVGVRRILLAPGEVPTPAHVHGGEEEIFYVLSGSGFSWQDGNVYEIRAGDCLVHLAYGAAHTLRAGDDGMEVLAYGERTRTAGPYMPNINRVWILPSWAPAGEGGHPYAAEPELDWSRIAPRPSSIVNAFELEPEYDGDAGRFVTLATKAGSVRTGLHWAHLEPGRAGAPPHCHSAEEEIFVVLDGEGTLELWPSPQSSRAGGISEREQHRLRPGDVVARPAGTRVSHYFLGGGEGGMTYLVYGTREPNDICYYPRSNKIFWRGVGLIARLESLEYDDGEPEEY